MMSTRGSSLPSIETRDLTAGKIFQVYRNGDPHFFGKRYVLNPRQVPNFDAFLNDLKRYVPTETAIRRVYTPSGGHRITDYSQLESEKVYVCAGKERFKRLNYTQIEAPSPRRRNRHSNRSDERLIPAHHNKHLENVTGKISQIPTQGKAIEVFVNGQDIDKPTTVGLSYRQLENMTEAIKVVHEAIREKHQYRVDQICDLEGHVVTDVNQLETGGLYVAKNSYHTFKPGRYEPHGRKNIIVPLSPRDKQQTKYLWKERTLPPINSQKKHSPDHSVSSYPETRKRNQVNGVPVKAAKHTKRTPKQADYDKDDGGVFKAKGQSRDTRGAKEVRDNGDTKVDLPIDQVRAEEVKDERIKKEKQGKDINNKAPTKQADHSHSRTIQNGDRSQADQSHNRTIQNGDRSQAKGEQSKPVVNNSQNKTVQQNTKQSTYKSNSKAPPPNTTKNDVKKQEPPKDNKNYSNHDSVRSSTPKDNKAAPPSKSPTDRRSVSPAKSPVNNKAASPAKSPSPMKDKKDPTPHEEHQAATKIQANYRGHQARKEVNDLKTKKETDEKKKKEDELRAKAAKEENQAATKIQAGFRGHQARKEINQKKQVRDVKNTKEDAAAIKIQSSYRGHKARKEIADKKVKRTEKNTEEEVAATKIQAGFRGHKARQEINQKKQQRTETKNEEEKAATKIQAGFRGNQARKEIDLKKKEKVKNEEEEKAATKIQAGFRGHQARKEVKKKKTKRLDGKTEAITAIQAAARGFLVRRRIEKRENTRQLLTLRSVAQEEVMDILGLIHERDKAATTIQSRYRGYKDRKEYKRIKVNEKKDDSLTFLQANFRAFLARKDINKRLLMEMRKLDTPVNRQGYSDSVDKVQASFHGFLLRKLAFPKLHQILKRDDSATEVQAAFKAYVERWHIRRRRVSALARYHKAASELQINFSSYLTRRSISANMSRRNSSASKIQAGVRGYFGRKGYLQQKQAVTRIQSGYRGYRARQQYESLAQERRSSAAATIQSNFRGFKVRKDIQLKTRNLAVEQLQACFHGYLLRRDVHNRIKQIKAEEMQKAAVKIQSKFRGYSERHRYDVMKRNHVNKNRRINAATEIQAHFRGYLSRKKAHRKPRLYSSYSQRSNIGDNSPLFVEGNAVRFDLQTTGSISSSRPRTGRLQASLSNISREQTFDIKNEPFVPPNDDYEFRSMARSTTAHVDSFSHLQESFRSLLSRRRKSTKPSQQLFHERTQLKALSQLQACFKGFLTRRLISRMCQYDRERSTVSSSPKHPSPVPLLRNPDEIRVSGSFEHPKQEVQSPIMPYNFNGEMVNFVEDDIPVRSSYHRQHSDVGREQEPVDDRKDEVPVQYVMRSRSKVSATDSNRSTVKQDDKPVQYLYRSRESTQHQTPHSTYGKSTGRNRYEEPSPVQSHDEEAINPVVSERRRFEEPSPIQSTSSPVLSKKRYDEISQMNDITNTHRFEEPSPQVHDHENVDVPLPNKDDSRYEEPSPFTQDDKVINDAASQNRRFEEPSPFLENNQVPVSEIGSSGKFDVHTSEDYENPNDIITHRSRFEDPSPSDTVNPDIEYPTSPRDTLHDLPSVDKFRNPSRITHNSNESELSIETFSRKLVNEIQSSALLKDEAVLILQAAFKGFILRNMSHSRRLKKLSKMDSGDKTIFDETAVPFLQAGFKGYLTQNRNVQSPPEM